jgi:protocatechuate 3,4-dioxygenase beta subunit
LARVTVVEGGGFSEAQIALWPAEPRRGEVTAAGLPLADARIVPIHAEDFPADASLYRHLPVLTGPEGTFEHPLLPAGAWQLLVSASGHAPALIQADEDGVFRAELGTGEKLTGRVVREGGDRPVNNAKLEIQARDLAGEVYSVRANAQGYFTVEGLRPATYQLRLAPGELRADLEVLVAPGSQEAQAAATPLSRNMKIDPLTGAAVATDASIAPAPSPAPAKAPPALQLVAQSAGSMRGRVLEAGADVGVPGVEIGLYSAESVRPVALASSDQAGYYQLKALTPGSYRLAATRTSGRVFLTESGPDVVVEGKSQQPGPILREVPPVSLVGQVLDDDGKPVSEANIVVVVAGYPGGALRFGSDGNGYFSVGGFHGGDQVELWAVRLDRESAHFGPVTIGATGLQDILLRMTAP